MKVEVPGLIAELKALNVTQHAILLEVQQANATLKKIADEMSSEIVGVVMEQTGVSPH